jgi:hypothetical protein
MVPKIDIFKCYVTPREDRPNPGNWRVGVVRGYDGEGHYQ